MRTFRPQIRAMINVLKALGLLLVLLLAYLVYFAQTSQTDYNFMLQSETVSAPVEVVFDDMAVPHIYAERESDAMFALGYVHASERLWQMDLLRRAGAGELSALLGPDMVQNDQYLRTLGMREAADRVTTLFNQDAPARIQEGMAQYLAGVNRFIAEGRTPLEYQLVGLDPEPFDTHDIYCATGFMAYSFAIHLKTEPILDWMKESRVLCEDIYVNTKVGEDLGYCYMYRYVDTARFQMQKGGIRLAKVLNDIFD